MVKLVWFFFIGIVCISLSFAAETTAKSDSVSFSGRLVTQYQLRWHGDTSDQDIAQYLALDVNNLWQDRVDIALYLRLWKDIDGNSQTQGNRYYYDYEGINDTFRRSALSRVYYGYVDVKNILGASQFRLGRQYLYEIEGLQFDGIRWKYDNLNGFDLIAFLGQPISYYSDTDGNRAVGGSIAYHPNNVAKLGLDYLHYSEDTRADNYFAGHFQYRFSNQWWIYSKYGILDSDPRDIQIQVNYTQPESGWNINATYFQQLKKLEQYTNQFSPYYTALADYAPFHQINLAIYKEFTPHFASEAGLNLRQLQHENDEGTYNRSYNLFYGTIIFRDIGIKGLEWSFTSQRWVTDAYTRTTSYYDDATAATPTTATGSFPSDSVTTIGSELRYRWQKKVTLNLGTDYSRYKYDYDTDSEKAKVRTIYAKCRWKINPSWEWYTKLSREKQQDDPDASYKLRSTVTYYF